MKNVNEVQSAEQITPHVTASSEDGMDFSELWIMLVRWKVTAIGVAFVTFFTIVADAYLDAPIPQYQARAYLSVPSIRQIAAINDTSVSKVFRAFVTNLNSRVVRLHYFNKYKLLDKLAPSKNPDAEYVFEERFNKNLSVTVRGNYAYVSFSGTNANLAAEWVNGFSTLANEETVNELLQPLISDANSVRKKQINLWSKEIAEKRKEIAEKRKEIAEKRKEIAEKRKEIAEKPKEIAEKRKEIAEKRKEIAEKRKEIARAAKQALEDRITRLEEAALIAELAGIKDMVFNWRPDHLFTLGSKILTAQIKVLRNSKNDTPNDDVIHLQKKNDAPNDDVIHLQKKIDELNDDVIHLQKKIDELNDDVIHLQKKIDELNDDVIHLQKKIDELNSVSKNSEIGQADYSHVSTMQFIEKATVPMTAFNMAVFKWIMFTAVLSAIVLGVLAAFFRDFVVRTREKNAMQSEQNLEG
jgi:LPS O-antigen subunit length determinant protein (WzzB/FepE family)